MIDKIIHNRVKALNKLYHTHLWQENIIDIEQFLIEGGEVFETKILSGNMDTVAALADRKKRNCFVFATKYCSFVNPDEYPIYDSLVSNVLYYQNIGACHRDNFVNYCEAMLTEFSFRDLFRKD